MAALTLDVILNTKAIKGISTGIGKATSAVGGMGAAGKSLGVIEKLMQKVTVAALAIGATTAIVSAILDKGVMDSVNALIDILSLFLKPISFVITVLLRSLILLLMPFIRVFMRAMLPLMKQFSGEVKGQTEGATPALTAIAEEMGKGATLQQAVANTIVDAIANPPKETQERAAKIPETSITMNIANSIMENISKTDILDLIGKGIGNLVFPFLTVADILGDTYTNIKTAVDNFILELAGLSVGGILWLKTQLTNLWNGGWLTAINELIAAYSDLANKLIEIGGKIWNWAITELGKYFEGLFKELKDLADKLSKFDIESFAKSLIGGAADILTGKKTKADDAIITPSGVVYTNPNDYIIATKNPGGLGGATTININISGSNNAQEIAKAVEDALRRSIKGRSFNYG